jgi:hypothetical protein
VISKLIRIQQEIYKHTLLKPEELACMLTLFLILPLIPFAWRMAKHKKVITEVWGVDEAVFGWGQNLGPQMFGHYTTIHFIVCNSVFFF